MVEYRNRVRPVHGKLDDRAGSATHAVERESQVLRRLERYVSKDDGQRDGRAGETKERIGCDDARNHLIIRLADHRNQMVWAFPLAGVRCRIRFAAAVAISRVDRLKEM